MLYRVGVRSNWNAASLEFVSRRLKIGDQESDIKPAYKGTNDPNGGRHMATNRSKHSDVE